MLRTDQLRHIQVICRFHGNRDVRDLLINGFLRSRNQPVTVNHRSVHPVWPEIAFPVLPDKPSQAFSHIQHLKLRKQIHQPVAGRRAGQPHDAFHEWPHLHQCLKPFGLPGLKTGKLIDHNHVKVKCRSALVHQPRNILPVDDVNISIRIQCRPSFCGTSHHHGIPDAF